MTNVSTAGDRLVVEMLGWDKVWALKSRVEVPLTHVAKIDTAAGERVRGVRLPGTYVPGVITAGTYRQKGKTEFWAVHDPQHAIAIELHDESFTRLVVEVTHPAETVAEVQQAITPRAS